MVPLATEIHGISVFFIRTARSLGRKNGKAMAEDQVLRRASGGLLHPGLRTPRSLQGPKRSSPGVQRTRASASSRMGRLANLEICEAFRESQIAVDLKLASEKSYNTPAGRTGKSSAARNSKAQLLSVTRSFNNSTVLRFVDWEFGGRDKKKRCPPLREHLFRFRGWKGFTTWASRQAAPWRYASCCRCFSRRRSALC